MFISALAAIAFIAVVIGLAVAGQKGYLGSRLKKNIEREIGSFPT